MIRNSEATALTADSIIVQRDDARTKPPRVYAPNNRTLDAQAFECRCPVCSSEDQ